MGSFKYTNQAFKMWLAEQGKVRTVNTHGYNSKKSIDTARAKKAKKKAEVQAYKDMESVVTTPSHFADPYFDTWDVSRAKVFSLESQNFNKKLTFL